ncbi:hypothetical protein CEXT_650611 [Caerostris extrusa]|uniref:Uncharacterized protein n=1 Tax=Caerostris extrusa TaxID=172846 RepID=A0AAV4MI28_CAEEX|nr:hypothetical protein CEXT_650611 [Caerostris extrusa]
MTVSRCLLDSHNYNSTSKSDLITTKLSKRSNGTEFSTILRWFREQSAWGGDGNLLWLSVARSDIQFCPLH